MAIGVNWKEIWAPVWKPVWTKTPPVEVPDVVGETQAAGTLELEAAGFVVAVETAYSSVVAAGLIISQNPAAGSTPGTGATVTITVSLGEAPSPPVSADQPAGGYAYLNLFELARIRREQRRRREKERRQDEDEIQQELDRQVAQALYQQEQRDAERADLARIQTLADSLMRQPTDLPRPVLASVLKAHEERTKNALLQLERVIAQMLEEEEAAIVAALLLDD